MENILARPATAISRNSDDFCPDKEGGFAEHLLQNGDIIEKGDHRKLLRAKGAYAELYNSQFA